MPEAIDQRVFAESELDEPEFVEPPKSEEPEELFEELPAAPEELSMPEAPELCWF